MKEIILLTICFSGIICNSPHGGNPHGGQLTIWELTDKLWALGDLDLDGHLSLAELEREFVTNFDHDGSGCAVSHEFVHQWQHNYQDTHQASVHVFQHFDMDHSGAVCHNDIQELFTAADHNKDNLIEKNEFDGLLLFVNI
ncbi:uncharacterized protein LOC133172464 [Saccostrea echinata]|uniref:uncharacterized protein LOC133172464 n=1 Tax=Saccostrea echinata TaxID=191078 RepID=UPI002A81AC44|nr:uncharacterized protein LOC133172464 [Saccostrea echinata]